MLYRRKVFSLARFGLLATVLSMTIFFQTEVSLFAQKGIEPDDWDVIPGRVIIEFTSTKSNALSNQVTTSGVIGLALSPIEQPVQQAARSAQGASTNFKSILPNTFIGEFDPVDRDQIFQALAADPDVVYFEPDRVRVLSPTWGTASPNDPNIGTLWGMERIGAPQTWAIQPTSRSNIRVAVMEQRYDDTHQDLTAQNSPVQNNMEPISQHATHVAGIIAATGNNGMDVAGVANVELSSLSWRTSSVTFAQQVSWAVNNGVDVINMSFKYCGNDGINNGDDCQKCLYPATSYTEHNAINSALGSIVFVASAGNDSCTADASGRWPLPVSYNGVIGVSALNQGDGLAGFSNFGPYVDITAPGVNITSTMSAPLLGCEYLNGATTGICSGTSMAAPHVSGSAATALVIDPTFDVGSISRLLALTAEDIGAVGKDNNFGEGVVRVDRAVDAIADVYAERSASCTGTGALSAPYCRLYYAVTNAPPGSTIGLVRGQSFAGPITISKPATFISVGGTAIIGQ